MKMTNCNSNDCITLLEDTEESTSSTDAVETRPLMLLFQRLISNDSKQNTVLTNAQIISILKKEFDIDINTLHDLEVEIYLNTIKRFLKDWPQWDEFDRGINWLRKKNQSSKDSIKKILESNYKNLKNYLRLHLDVTRPLASEAVAKITAESSKTRDQVDTSDIILEIYCTRKQLNELMYNHPNSELKNNVFHLPEFDVTSISMNTLSMESILNWWGVQVSMEMRSISLTWSTMHHVKHVLVNKNNGPRDLKKILNQNVQLKEQKKLVGYTEKSKIYEFFDAIIEEYPFNDKMNLLVKNLLDMIRSDLETLNGDKIKVPGTYRRYKNKYPYYRKLCKETYPQIPPSGKVVNLYIEETLSPMHVFYIGKIGSKPVIQAHNAWLTVECVECKTKFSGMDLQMLMKEHFDLHHANEPDWTCTNCEKTFPMLMLTQKRWYHDCGNT